MLYAVVTELGEIVAVSVEGQEPSLGGAGHNVSHRSTHTVPTRTYSNLLSLTATVYMYNMYIGRYNGDWRIRGNIPFTLISLCLFLSLGDPFVSVWSDTLTHSSVYFWR